MKYISLILFIFMFCGCTARSMNEKGDIYSLYINTTEDFKKYKAEVQRLEKELNLRALPSYNQKGLHLFIDVSVASNIFYYFIPEDPSKGSFYIDNIEGTNTCGSLTFEEGKQEEIFKYGIENFPYFDIYRDGEFPLNGDKKAYDHILGYRQTDVGERRYFSYFLFKERSVGKKKMYLVGFSPIPKVIDEYENVLNTIGSTVSSVVTRDACKHL